MKASFFRKIVRSQILKEFPGFVLADSADMLIIPMNHIWRGFVFEGSASPEFFYPNFNVLPLYTPRNFFHVGLGSRLICDDNSRIWGWKEDKAAQVVEQLIRAFKSAKEKYLDKLSSPLEIARNGPALFGMAENQLEIYGFSLVYAGEFEEASSMVEALCNMHEARRRPGEAKEPQQVHREHIRDLLKTDPEAAHAQLVAWEQQAIKNFKLEKFAN